MASANGPGAAGLEDLIRAARAGSAPALGGLLEAFRPYLLLIANEELDEGLQAKLGASDVVQDTFLKARTEFPGFLGQSRQELLAWLRQILRNHLANLRTQYLHTQKREAGRELPLAEAPREELQTGLTDPSPTPSTQAAANEQWEIIERGLAQLPEHYACVIRLRNLESRSFPEIGTQLGCTEEAARKLWTRALKQLQEILERRP